MRLVILAIVLSSVLAGCKAEPPGNLETHLMTFAEHRFLIGDKRDKNPLPDTIETRADGKEAFSHYCIACHGLDGQNTGVPFVDHISPPIPSLASRQVQRFTDGQLKWIVNYGIRPSGMPGSQGTLSDEEQWSIVVYLRHLPPAGSLGEPDMYTH